MSITRANHYVPRLYLKRFASESGYLYHYRTLVSKPTIAEWKKVNTGGIAYRSHLYTRTLAYGDSDEIEQWLNRDFETPAESSIAKAVNGDRLKKEDYWLLTRFVAAQIVRTPAFLIENLPRWREFAEQEVKQVSKRLEERIAQRHYTSESFEEDPSPDMEYYPFRISSENSPDGRSVFLKAEIVVGRGTWIFAMRHLLTNTIHRLSEHRWTILSAEDDLPWFTTDDPVVRLNFRNASDYDFKGAWGVPKTNIFLPLSPRHLLFTQVGEKSFQRNEILPRNMAIMIRKMIAEHAHRYIFSPAPDNTIAQFRPRIIDADAMKSEEEQWRIWHDQQSAAERELIFSRYPTDTDQ